MRLNISSVLNLPIDAVTQTFAILAVKGSGKSYTASVMAEEMLKCNQHIVVLDLTGAWYGLKSSADGKSAGFPIAIFGGDHGDVPLEDSAGEIIATAIIEKHFNAIIDLSAFRKSQTTRFLAPFLETLYRLNRDPLHLFADEADAYVPQKVFGDQARTVGAMEDIVRRGRKRGIGCSLITQRPASINKDVLTQCEILVALRMVHPRDINAIVEWTNVNATVTQAKEMLVDLPSMETGSAYIWSPSWLKLFKKISIRRRETFDSGATPKPGQSIRKPKKLASIDIKQLGKEIEDTIERRKAEDPRELKRKITELEKQIGSQKPQVEQKKVEVPVLKDKQIERLEKILERSFKEFHEHGVALNAVSETITTALSDIRKAIGTIAEIYKKQAPIQAKDFIYEPGLNEYLRTNPMRPPQKQPKEQGIYIGEAVTAPSKEVNLRGGAKRMLAALVQWSPHGMTEGQMRSHAGMKNSGSFSQYKSDLRTGGFAEKCGELWFATQHGIDTLGYDVPAPKTTQEVLDVWMPKLRGGAKRMLEVLVRLEGKFISDQVLQEQSGMSNSGSYGQYKSDLKTAQLIITQSGQVAANKETLFL